mgnify:CR=1 FL=1
MLTVLIIIFGLGAAATILTQLAQLIMEGNLLAVWRKRRMDKKIARIRDHVIICGYGRIGQAICRHLRNMGVECLILDRDDSRVRIRLNSTAIGVANVANGEVRTSYVQGGQGYTVRSKGVVMACWNTVIPHLCREVTPEQRRMLQAIVDEYGNRINYIAVTGASNVSGAITPLAEVAQGLFAVEVLAQGGVASGIDGQAGGPAMLDSR